MWSRGLTLINSQGQTATHNNETYWFIYLIQIAYLKSLHSWLSVVYLTLLGEVIDFFCIHCQINSLLILGIWWNNNWGILHLPIYIYVDLIIQLWISMEQHLLTVRSHMYPEHASTPTMCYTVTSLNWTIHGWEIRLFCYITNSRIVENENASVTWSILGINSYDAILVTVWCCLPVNYLLSSLCNWFWLVPDWFKPVLRNIYCFIIAKKKWYFPFAYQF